MNWPALALGAVGGSTLSFMFWQWVLRRYLREIIAIRLEIAEDVAFHQKIAKEFQDNIEKVLVSARDVMATYEEYQEQERLKWASALLEEKAGD